MDKKRRVMKLLLAGLVIWLYAASGQKVRASDDWWRGRYFNNRDMSGSPVLARDEKAIDFDWGGGSPSDKVDSDDFSARWTRSVYLNEGIYRFSATMDDGMRVFIDGALVIDEWRDSQARTVEIDLPMTAGDHDLEVHYYEAGGEAIAKFSYGPASGPPDTPYDRWQGRYFNNPSLFGPPTFVRADNEIDFNWKAGSPWPTIDDDFFSAYWTGIFQHTPGTYRFTVLTDDGVRLWVNDKLIIDEWHNNQSVTYVAETTLPGGAVPVRLDYYENQGAALIKYTVEKTAGGGSTPPSTPTTPQAALPPEGSAVVVNANWLSVRAAPASGDNVITAAAGGEVVQLLGRYGGWVKVRLPSGVEGWVGGRFLDSRTPLTSLPVLTE